MTMSASESDSGGADNTETLDSNVRVLLIDSGIGGLSVFQCLAKKMPYLNIDYFCDHEFFPYGTKTPDSLITRLQKVVETLLSTRPYDLVVIACNTASTVVLPVLRATFDVPFVGVVPAIKPACQMSKTRKVGLLATEGTVTREYTHNLIEEFGCDVELTLIGSCELVLEAEKKLSGQSVNIDILRAALKPFKALEIDTIVLGCTHFPLLMDELNEVVDWPVQWIDSGKAIACRVECLLRNDLKIKEFEPVDAIYRFYNTNESSASDLVNFPISFSDHQRIIIQ